MRHYKLEYVRDHSVTKNFVMPDQHSGADLRDKVNEFVDANGLMVPRLAVDNFVPVECFELSIVDGKLVTRSDGVYEIKRPREPMTLAEYNHEFHVLTAEMSDEHRETFATFVNTVVGDGDSYPLDNRNRILEVAKTLLYPHFATA